MKARVPRYQEIAEDLRARIQRGELAPGVRLDTHRQLATTFGVTLMTLRQALEVLEREKLIERRHVLALVAAAPTIDYDLQLLRLSAGVSSAHEDLTTTRLRSAAVAGGQRRTAALRG